MRLMLVRPSAFMYSQIFLRLEPPGVERVAAARQAGDEVTVVDLRVFSRPERGHGIAAELERRRIRPSWPGARSPVAGDPSYAPPR